jgi:hypothetical protein
LRTLAAVTAALESFNSSQLKAAELQNLYAQASREFAIVETLVRPQHGAGEWLDPVSQGLDRYVLAEGW